MISKPIFAGPTTATCHTTHPESLIVTITESVAAITSESIATIRSKSITDFPGTSESISTVTSELAAATNPYCTTAELIAGGIDSNLVMGAT